MYRVGLGQVSSEYFVFSCEFSPLQSTAVSPVNFHLTICPIALTYYPGLIE
jgi:hypothetical protein